MTYPLTIGRMSFQVANIHIFLNTNAKKNKALGKDTDNQQNKNKNRRPRRPAEGTVNKVVRRDLALCGKTLKRN